MFRRHLLSFLLTLWASASYGFDSIRFGHLSIDAGLSQAVVKAIAQDRDGFIWIGTQEGLNRYDGYEFVTYRHVPEDSSSLHHSWVYSVFVDREGRIWIGTKAGGLDRYDPEHNRFLHFPVGAMHDSEVQAIAQDATGYLWIGTHGSGLVRLDPATGATKRYLHDPTRPTSITSDRVTDIHIVDDNEIWLATNGGGLNRFDPTSETAVHVPFAARLRAITADASGSLWIATYDSGLGRIDLETGAVRRYRYRARDPTSLSADDVRALLVDSDGVLWVGTDSGGLNRYDPQADAFMRFQSEPTDFYSLSDNHVATLLQDVGGVIWAGTYRGISKWNPQVGNFTTFARQFGQRMNLSAGQVTTFASSADGDLWVGTASGGLNRVNLDTAEVTHYRSDTNDLTSLSDDRVYALRTDPHGGLWVATKGGLNYMDPVSGHFMRFLHDADDPNSLSHNGVTSVLVDDDALVWVGTIGGLNRLDPGTGVFERFTPTDASGAMSSDRVVALFRDSRGVILVGTHGGGMNVFDRAALQFTAYRHDPSDMSSISSDVAWSFDEDRFGNIWIGTDAGINLWSADARRTGQPIFQRYGVPHGLKSATVYGVLTDSEGKVWVSTNRGLAYLDRNEERFYNFDVSHGLQDNEFNHGAQHRRGSQMFFGGLNGFTVFDPMQIKRNDHAPRLALTRFYRHNAPVPLPSLTDDEGFVTLTHKDHMITFEYAALDFTAPKRNMYRHRLVGFDEAWIDDGSVRRATYTNLEPGDYTLEVEGANNDGLWSRERMSIDLRVLPPPWATAWAVTAYALLAIGALFLMFRSVARRIAVARQIQHTNAILRAEIAERQAQQLALQREKLNAQRYLDVVEVIILALDANGAITTVNQKGVRVLGYSEQELIGADFFATLVPPNQRARVRSLFENVEEYDYSESPVLTRGGAEHLIAWHAIQLPETDDHPSGLIISGTDVTQVRELEQQVRESQKMEALGTLASGIAHDFNNVLSSILGFAQLSRGEVGRDSKVDDYLGQLEMSVERARNLVHHILTFRGQAHQDERAPTLVQSVIHEALQLIRPSIPSNIEIRSYIESSCGPVMADPTQLHQLMMNLSTNAYQAMGEDGGVLKIELTPIDVDAETARTSPVLSPGPHVRIVVEDTGEGMDRATIARIFDPFFTTRQRGEGTGLGLSVVHGIVTQHGGAISVESELGAGTRFEVVLPCCDQQPAGHPPEITTTNFGAQAKGETILFVDDEPDVVTIARELLTKLGYTLLTATTGTEALRVFEANADTIDLVVTDQTMPNMVGPRLAETIKNLRADMPIILMSGGGAEHANDPAVTRFISKPYTLHDLAQAIRDVLDTED